MGLERRVLNGFVVAAAVVVFGAIALERRSALRKQDAPAPAVSLPLLDGGGQASPRPGHVTVVDFWATWCAPCRSSMSRLQTVWGEYKARGVDLYSVNTDEAGPNRDPLVREFLLVNQLKFPVVLDENERAVHAFNVSNLPTLVVVGKDGKVAWRDVGALTASRERLLRGELDRALGK